MNTRRALFAVFAPTLILIGCDRNASETVNTSEPAVQSAPGGASAGMPAQAAGGGPAGQMPAAPHGQAPVAAPGARAEAAPAVLTYTLPSGWTEEPGGSNMRYATLKGPDGATIAVTVFGGNVGGDLANVNRWRQQMGLEAVTQEQLAQNLTKVQTAGPTAQVTDLKNADGTQRMLAAIVPDEGKTWFLKMQGPTDVVTKHAEEYNQILKSCKFGQPQP